mgnify:CR=1 FL=1
MRDRGQAAITAVLLTAALLTGAVAASLELGDRVVDRRRAQSAADAAALAGAADGPSAARHLAAANGAQLRAFRIVGDAVVVTVSVDAAVATARASTAP